MIKNLSGIWEDGVISNLLLDFQIKQSCKRGWCLRFHFTTIFLEMSTSTLSKLKWKIAKGRSVNLCICRTRACFWHKFRFLFLSPSPSPCLSCFRRSSRFLLKPIFHDLLMTKCRHLILLFYGIYSKFLSSSLAMTCCPIYRILCANLPCFFREIHEEQL